MNEQQLTCLALNIYHEARGEPLEGQLAVAFVTHNRAMDRSGEFRRHNTYCDVVKQGYKPGKMSCHFSWYCDGKSDKAKDLNSWRRIKVLAKQFIMNYHTMNDPTKGAMHYHTVDVKPWWTNKMSGSILIGDHYFWVK